MTRANFSAGLVLVLILAAARACTQWERRPIAALRRDFACLPSQSRPAPYGKALVAKAPERPLKSRQQPQQS